MSFTYQNQNFNIKRYPHHSNNSLKAWSAADEHILQHLDELGTDIDGIVTLGDRFGFLSCMLHDRNPLAIITTTSQEKAIHQNVKSNKLKEIRICAPLSLPDSPISLGIVKIPKSLDLFELYLWTLSKSLKSDAVVLCGFMTRHFTPKMLQIANRYFESIEQSRTFKKSKVLILKAPKPFQEQELIHDIEFNGTIYKQFYGVFSAKHIDYATQFLIENLDWDINYTKILDLASGNGVLAVKMRELCPDSEIHLIDDFQLAVDSSKLNLESEKTHFHCNDNLDDFESNTFDCIISNPPFHFEHENTIETSLQLFKDVNRCLTDNGEFILVANQHLNYKTHLVKLFLDVDIVHENSKFVVYRCFGKV